MSIGGRPLRNLRFADDMDLLGGSDELQQLTERLEKTAGGYGMEISCDKSKSQDHRPTYEWMGKRLKKWTTQTKDGTSITEVKNQTGASTLNHDQGRNRPTQAKQSH